MSMNPNMIGQVPVGMGAPITNYASKFQFRIPSSTRRIYY